MSDIATTIIWAVVAIVALLILLRVVDAAL